MADNELLSQLAEVLKPTVRDSIRETMIELTANDSLSLKYQESDLMSSDEAAEYLKIPISTIYQKTHKNEIPYMKRGKRLLFSRARINEWLTADQ